MKKRIGFIFIVLFSSLLLSISVLVLYAKTDHAKDRVLYLVNARIPGTLHAGKMSFSLIGGWVELQNILLSDVNQRPCLDLKAIRCEFRLSDLFSRVIRIYRLSFLEPGLTLVQTPDGRFNLMAALGLEMENEPEPRSPTPAQFPFNLIVDRADIRDGTLSFRSPRDEINVDHIGLKVMGADFYRRVLRLEAHVKGGQIQSGGRQIQMDDLRLEGGLTGEGDLKLTAGLDSVPLALRAEGGIHKVFTMPELDLDIHSTLRLDQLSPLIGDQVELRGLARIRISGSGALNAPELSMGLAIEGLAMNDAVENGAVNVDATLFNQKFSLEKGDIRFMETLVRVWGDIDFAPLFPDGFLKPPGDPAQVTYTLSYDLDNGDLSRLHKWLNKGGPRFSGRFSSRGRIQGKGIDPNTLDTACDLSFALDGVRPDSPGISEMDASGRCSVRISRGIVEVSQCLLDAQGARMAGSGRFDLAKETLAGKMEIDAVDIAAAARPLGFSGIKGSLLADVDISGTFSRPSARARIQGKDLTAGGKTVSNLDFEGELDTGGRAVIHRLTLTEGNMHLGVKGTADLFAPGLSLRKIITSDLSVRGKHIDPDHLLGMGGLDPGIESLVDLNLDMKLGVAMDSPVRGIEVREFLANGLKVGAVIDLDKKWIGAELEKVARLDARLTPGTNQYRASMAFDQSDLTSMLSGAGFRGIQAYVNGDIHAAGRMPAPVPPGFLAALETAGGRVSMTAEIVPGPAAFNKGTDPGGTCRLTLSGADLHIPLGSAGGISRSMDLDAFDADLETLFQPSGEVKRVVKENKQFPFSRIRGDLSLNPAALSLSLDQTAEIKVAFEPEKGAYDIDAGFTGAPLGPYLVFAGLSGIQARLDGRITATGNAGGLVPDEIIQTLGQGSGSIHLDADISGTLAYPAIEGQVGIGAEKIKIPIPSHPGPDRALFLESLESGFDLALSRRPLGNGFPGDASPGKIPVNRILAEVDLGALSARLDLDDTIKLRAAVTPESSAWMLDFSLGHTPLDRYLAAAGLGHIRGTADGFLKSRGRADMELPGDIVHGLENAQGRIDIDGNFKGSFRAPGGDARIRLSGIGIPIARAGIFVSDLNGEIRAEKDGLAIEKLGGKLGTGQFTLDGRIDLEEFEPVKGDLSFRGENIAFELPDAAQVAFNYDIRFSGNRDRSAFTGDVELIKGEYFKDFSFDLAGGERRRKSSDIDPGLSTGFSLIDRAALNIRMDYKSPFVLDNNLAFMMIGPNVALSGTVSNPVVTGRARITQGIVFYQKREFEIQKGIMDFTDPYRTDPDIDLAAKTQIRDWEISLEVTGKTDNLKFRLYSEPRETHTDILSLLITGKTTGELGRGGTSYTGFLTDQASDFISKSIEEATPLDSFKVGYDGSDGGGVNVTMGKKLSRCLEVTYASETKDEETVYTNTAKYKLLENLILKAFNDSKGDFGTEMTFKLEFR